MLYCIAIWYKKEITLFLPIAEHKTKQRAEMKVKLENQQKVSM